MDFSTVLLQLSTQTGKVKGHFALEGVPLVSVECAEDGTCVTRTADGKKSEWPSVMDIEFDWLVDTEGAVTFVPQQEEDETPAPRSKKRAPSPVKEEQTAEVAAPAAATAATSKPPTKMRTKMAKKEKPVAVATAAVEVKEESK